MWRPKESHFRVRVTRSSYWMVQFTWSCNSVIRNKTTAYRSIHWRGKCGTDSQSRPKIWKDSPAKTKSFVQRFKTLLDKGWPAPSQADGNVRISCENQRTGKCKDCFERGLTPPGLKQKAHIFLIELIQYAVGETVKNIGISTGLLIDTGATCSVINCDTFTVIEKFKH